MFIKNNIVNKINKEKSVLLLIYFLYTILIIFSVSRYFNYNNDYFLYTGDFRIHSQIVDENTSTLFNFRLMSDTTPYVSLSPIFSIFKYFNINFIFFFIIYLIPIFSFYTMSFVLMKYIKVKEKNLKHFTVLTLSFLYIINPSYFNRIGHWNINYLYMFIPIFYYYSDKFLIEKNKFYLLFIIFPISYFGVSSPHSMVGFLGILLLLILFNFKKNFIYLLRSSAILLVYLYSISHNFIAMLLKNNIVIKTSWEGETTSNILRSLSSKSNLVSSLSGTNYYYDKLIQHPTIIGAGIIIFCLIIYLIYKKNTLSRHDLKTLTLLIIFIIINIGYNSVNYIYDFILLKISLTRNLLWLIKDPNIFYNFLIFFLVLNLGININILKNKIIKVLIIILVVNIFHIFYSDISEYKKFYKMFNLQNEYVEVQKHLNNITNRTLWIPSNVYVNNKYTSDVTYFPNFNLWLTSNKEVTISNEYYKNFIDTLNYEIIDNKCNNKNVISWLLKSNNVSLIIDSNSLDEQIAYYNKCIANIDSIVLSKNINEINIYDSNMTLIANTDIIVFKRSKGELDKYLENNPYKYITFEDITHEKGNFNKFIEVPYNKNVKYDNNNLKGSVNIISSYYNDENNNGGLKYTNDKIYKNYIKTQLFLSVLSILIYVIIILPTKRKIKI